MSTSQKLLLSLPVVLLLLYQATFIAPSYFLRLIPSMKIHYILNGSIGVLYLSTLFFLLRRMWSYTTIDRKLKVDWTWNLILFGWITTFIYIWKKDKEFHAMHLTHK